MLIVEVLVVLVLGFFNFLVGIPLGYAFGLATPTIFVTSLVGCVGGTVVLVYLGDRVMPPLRRAWARIVQRVLPGLAITLTIMVTGYMVLVHAALR